MYRERGRRWAYAVVERVYESCGVVWRMKDDGRPRSIGMGMARAIERVGRGGCACHALHAHQFGDGGVRAPLPRGVFTSGSGPSVLIIP